MVPASLSIILTEASRQCHTISDRDYYHKIISLTIGGLVGLFFLRLYTNHTKQTITTEAFISFLKNYEDLKQYLPQHLLKTFDAMFQEYLKNGKNYFQYNKFYSLITTIQDEIIKNNSTQIDKKTNKTLISIVSLTSIVLVIINTLILNNVANGLHSLHQDVDYWGIRAILKNKMINKEV